MNLRVSAIVIFYNEEDVLDDAISSVFAQTYADWELLLIDDGSTDRSATIAKRWENEHPDRVRCLAHEGGLNRGASASRNLGICHARGEFVAFLDADDLWRPEKLAHQVAIMDDHPSAGMICGTSLYAYHWDPDASSPYEELPKPVGAPPGRRHANRTTMQQYEAITQAGAALQDRLIEPPELLTRLYPLGAGLAPCPSNLLLRKSAILAAGGFEESFRGDLQLYEDQVFLTKVYLSCPVFISSRALDVYRIRSTSCVARVTREGKYHSVRRAYLEWLEQHLSTVDVQDAEVDDALRSALFSYRHPIMCNLRDKADRMHEVAGNSVGRMARRFLSPALHSRIRSVLGLRSTGPGYEPSKPRRGQ